MNEFPPIINEINIRTNLGTNKFIQLFVDDKPYFRFICPDDFKYHFNILENTLAKEFHIYPEYNQGIPLKKGHRYNLVGAGIFMEEEGKIFLSGESIDYEIGPNIKHAEEISKLTGLELIII